MVIAVRNLRKIGCLLTAVCLLAVFSGASLATGETQEAIPVQTTEETAGTPVVGDAFQLLDENDGFALYFHPSTAQVAVQDKRNGQVWYSNPQSSSLPEGSSLLAQESSQLLVYYYQDNQLTTMDSQSYSVAIDQFESSFDDGVLTVRYTIGDETFTNDRLPAVISQERMENDIFSKLQEEEISDILNRYDLFVYEELEGTQRDVLVSTYPVLQDHPIYVRKNFPDYIGERIYELFQKAGYTLEDLQRDCDENQVENTYTQPVIVHIALQYTLTDDGLSVTLDPSSITYTQGYPPVRVDILPYFGCGSSTEEGYMLVPDGNGAIIRFNNGKLNTDSYWKKLFGADKALNHLEQGDDGLPSVLPVYGISKGTGAFLATIDEGYEVAGIYADIAGKLGSYNYVGGFFDIMPSDSVSMNGNVNSADSTIVTADRMVEGRLTVSYHFMDKPAAYDELAVAYRGLLMEKGILKKNEAQAADIHVEFIGTAKVKKSFFGFHYESLDALTTYRQAAEILEELGVANTDVRYACALNGGKDQSLLDTIKLESVLGSGGELDEIGAKSLGVAFSAEFRTASKLSKARSARALSRDIVKLYEYDFIGKYITKEDPRYLVSPAYMAEQSEKLAASLANSRVDSLLLMDGAYELDGDYNESALYDRVQTRAETEKLMQKLSGQVQLSADVGSVYAFPYLSKVWNLPSGSSGYAIEDEAVPFYAIVLSGCLPYCTSPLNESADMHRAFLKAVEIGAGIQFSWIYEKAENPVDYTQNYAGRVYTSTLEDAKGYAQRMQTLNEQVGGASIAAHRRISPILAETHYDNGVTVYVNYGQEPAEISGVTIEPQDFQCLEKQ